jgi:hypothetical protein
MRRYLLSACEATGVADEKTLAGAAQGVEFTLSTTGVSVVLDRSAGRPLWRIQHLYNVVDMERGGWREVSEVVEIFSLGDETRVAKAAVMKAVEHVVDAAIDSAG